MKRMDFHVHALDNPELSAKASAAYFREMCETYGYEGVCVLAFCKHENDPNNELVLAIKEHLPGSFAFASPRVGHDFAKDAEYYMNNGFDGIKLIRGGKPNHHRECGEHFWDDPIYAEMFAYCEENSVPITLHNNDPLIHWDVKNAPQRAIERGWVYDETYPSQATFFEKLEKVLVLYPRLNIAIAHMGFYSDNLPHAAELLDRYPNLKFDVTPAILIYEQLSQTPAESEAFFRKYHDRLIFGTDAEADQTGERKAYTNLKNRLTSAFFGGGEPVTIEGRYIHPIHLEPEMLENIYYNNAISFVGQFRK
ncbi:MAG: amidohydrolase family protein [Clostridia bacterium]|nr:amidohydrolase family protein [Clostridia bacterium]